MGLGASKQSATAGWVQAALLGDEGSLSSLTPEELAIADAEGNTVLGAAACGGHLTLVSNLLDRGAPVATPNGLGMSPTWLAAGYGHLEVLNVLVLKGGDVNEASKQGDTPLIAAASRDHKHIVQRLLELQADTQALNNSGDSALSVAAARGFNAVVQLLVMEAEGQVRTGVGSIINRPNVKRISPLHASVSNGDRATVEVWLQLAPPPHPSPFTHSPTHLLPSLQALLAAGADPSLRDANGASALAIACFTGNEEAATALLAVQGIDLEAKDSNGTTALWLASSRGATAIVQRLLEAGANKEGCAEVAETNKFEDCAALIRNFTP